MQRQWNSPLDPVLHRWSAHFSQQLVSRISWYPARSSHENCRCIIYPPPSPSIQSLSGEMISRHAAAAYRADTPEIPTRKTSRGACDADKVAAIVLGHRRYLLPGPSWYSWTTITLCTSSMMELRIISLAAGPQLRWHTKNIVFPLVPDTDAQGKVEDPQYFAG